MYRERVMDNLPVEVIRKICSYDSTYKIKFDKVLKQLTAHCFIYNSRICFKPYNNCYCYCSRCKAYLKFCQQLYFDNESTYDDDLNDIVQLGFSNM